MAKNKQRFVVTENGGGFLSEIEKTQVIVDQLTGVNYLWIKNGYAGGVTPLLNPDGSPIVTRPQND